VSVYDTLLTMQNHNYCVPKKIGAYNISVFQVACTSTDLNMVVVAQREDNSHYTASRLLVTHMFLYNSGSIRSYLTNELNNKARYCVMVDLMGRLCEGNTDHHRRIQSISEKS
jgi:hypothetical protein